MLMSSVIAHRGARQQAAENTLRAITLAAEQGARWVELDVMLTADGIPVVFHDRYLDQLTNGYGELASYRFEQLQRLRVHAPINSDEQAQPIPTLAEALQQLHALGLGLNLEIKPSTRSLWRETLQASLAVIQQSAPLPLVLSSFRHKAIAEALQLAPGIPRALLWERLPHDWKQTALKLEVRAIHLAEFALRRWQVAEIRASGFEVYVYTVNCIKRGKQLKSWGVNGVFTDHPAAFLSQPEWTTRQVRAYGEPL